MADNDIHMEDTSQVKKEVSTNTVMGVLAYIGPLVIVSYLVAKDDPFVKFHIKQGLVLLVIEIAMWVIVSFLWLFAFLIPFVNLVVLILAIVGIVNVIQNKEKELPLVGGFARHFKI